MKLLSMSRYKRYMIMSWDEYDNVSPFDCVVNSTYDLDLAIKIYNQLDDHGSCIFDRVEGVAIEYKEREE